MRRRRRRWSLPYPAIAMLRLVGFRYDYERDAYILRLIGGRFGPVLRDRDDRASTIGSNRTASVAARPADKVRDQNRRRSASEADRPREMGDA